MARIINRGEKQAGAAPGTLIYVGDRQVKDVEVTVIEYTESELNEYRMENVSECCVFLKSEPISWMNVAGIHDVEVLQKIGECFGLHTLVLEDILNTNQRPKLEAFDGYIFLVVKMITYDKAISEIHPEQVSLILGENFVISLQEDGADVLEPVRNRLRGGKGRIRKSGADFLAYAIVDAVVDNYFSVLESLGDEIEELEVALVEHPAKDTLKRIHILKRELIYLRRAVWPLRECVNILLRDESALVHEETKVFLRDLYDHVVQVIDAVETLRDLVSGMLDVYLSSISNRMNEIMKVLTIISTIFIPLTFIVGVYGMNFDDMPELRNPYGYPVVIGVMAFIAGSLLYFFRRKRWI